jgi:hypothetical protein
MENSPVEGTSMEQKTRVFCQINVQEFHLSKYLLFGCAAKLFYSYSAWIFMSFIQNCFFSRPSDYTVLKDGGLETRTIRQWHWQSDALTTRLDTL